MNPTKRKDHLCALLHSFQFFLPFLAVIVGMPILCSNFFLELQGHTNKSFWFHFCTYHFKTEKKSTFLESSLQASAISITAIASRIHEMFPIIDRHKQLCINGLN